jgi:hypothetical protein
MSATVSERVSVMRWQKHIPANMTLRLPAGSIHGSSPNLEQMRGAMVEMRQTISVDEGEYQNCLPGLNGLIRMNMAYRGRLESLEPQDTVESN